MLCYLHLQLGQYAPRLRSPAAYRHAYSRAYRRGSRRAPRHRWKALTEAALAGTGTALYYPHWDGPGKLDQIPKSSFFLFFATCICSSRRRLRSLFISCGTLSQQVPLSSCTGVKPCWCQVVLVSSCAGAKLCCIQAVLASGCAAFKLCRGQAVLVPSCAASCANAKLCWCQPFPGSSSAGVRLCWCQVVLLSGCAAFKLCWCQAVLQGVRLSWCCKVSA